MIAGKTPALFVSFMILPGNRYTRYNRDYGIEHLYRSRGLCQLWGVLEYLPGTL